MATNESLGRDDWVLAGTKALASGGLAAVRVEALARVLGVTKGSFYWHFANRAALVEAILEGWEQRQTLSIIEQVESGGGDAGVRLEALSRLAAADSDHAVEMALRDAARRDEAIAAFVERVDGERMNYLRGLFGDLGYPPLEAEARSLLAYSLLIGDYFIAAGDGRTHQIAAGDGRTHQIAAGDGRTHQIAAGDGRTHRIVAGDGQTDRRDILRECQRLLFAPPPRS